MPEVSRFFGIIITMYYETGTHQHPHFHARFGEYRASFTVSRVWIERHQYEQAIR